ncbi:MAG: nucleotide-binding protein [Actinomycetaceae bacterium]
MSHGILLALTDDEAEVVRVVDAPGSGARVVRRCADLTELLGGVAAGIGSVAVLSSQMLGVDRASVGRLVAAGAKVLLVGPTADAARLDRLGAHGTATESDTPETVAAMAIALARGERVGASSSARAAADGSAGDRSAEDEPGSGLTGREPGRSAGRSTGRSAGGAGGSDDAGGSDGAGTFADGAVANSIASANAKANADLDADASKMGAPGEPVVPDVVPVAWISALSGPDDAGGAGRSLPGAPDPAAGPWSGHGSSSGHGAAGAGGVAGDGGTAGDGGKAGDGGPSRPRTRRDIHRRSAEDSGKVTPEGADQGAPEGCDQATPTGSSQPTSTERDSDGAGTEAVISEVPWWLSSGAGAGADVLQDATTSTPEELVDSPFVPSEVPVESEEPGRVVVVWGTRGAPGRTTIAVNLAAEAAAGGMSTVLVDADTEAPSLAQVLGLTDDISSIAAVTRMAMHGRLDAAAARSALAPVADDLSAVTGLTRPDRWRELEDVSLESVWEVLREVARVVVVDVGAGAEENDGGDFGPARHQATLSALAAADEVVVVGAADPVGMRRLVLTLTEARERGLAEQAGRTVVVNRVRRAAAGPDPALAVREALFRYAGTEDAVLVPHDAATADAALLGGTTWRESAQGSGARRAVQDLAHRLLDLPEAGTARRRWWRRGARA